MAENGRAAETSVSRCLAQVRRMIWTGELLPGEKVHQVELAERLDVSRIPLREALSTLHAEGVLDHKPNTGYRVARFSSEDLSEIYVMRRLLETELLKSIDLDEVDVAEFEALDDLLSRKDPELDVDEYERMNERFHFLLFDLSPLQLVRAEVARLWYMSGFYRSLYLHGVASHDRVDHAAIIKALRTKDLDALIAAHDAHRRVTERLVIERLGRSRPRK